MDREEQVIFTYGPGVAAALHEMLELSDGASSVSEESQPQPGEKDGLVEYDSQQQPGLIECDSQQQPGEKESLVENAKQSLVECEGPYTSSPQEPAVSDGSSLLEGRPQVSSYQASHSAVEVSEKVSKSPVK